MSILDLSILISFLCSCCCCCCRHSTNTRSFLVSLFQSTLFTGPIILTSACWNGCIWNSDIVPGTPSLLVDSLPGLFVPLLAGRNQFEIRTSHIIAFPLESLYHHNKWNNKQSVCLCAWMSFLVRLFRSTLFTGPIILTSACWNGCIWNSDIVSGPPSLLVDSLPVLFVPLLAGQNQFEIRTSHLVAFLFGCPFSVEYIMIQRDATQRDSIVACIASYGVIYSLGSHTSLVLVVQPCRSLFPQHSMPCHPCHVTSTMYCVVQMANESNQII